MKSKIRNAVLRFIRDFERSEGVRLTSVGMESKYLYDEEDEHHASEPIGVNILLSCVMKPTKRKKAR